ncbi:hypothetical protein FOZ60_016254 [Perkinsus olseni]|uniref:Uncharacterized protein n=1 Tax=Perkinsus olseni TaxID=32597 RepID=A0A7J6N436_PEROL|nr:hypothetical protein FOZ60_016254 [Perkinsus olseni]
MQARAFVLNETKGLSLQVVAKLRDSFWDGAAKVSIPGDAGDDVVARKRQLLSSVGMAVTSETGSYVDVAAERAKKDATAKQIEADLKKLVATASARLGHEIPFALLPSAKVVAAVRNGKFTELAEYRTFSANEASGTEFCTSVDGNPVEVIVPKKDSEHLFVPGAEVPGCLLRWSIATWLAFPEGNLLVLISYCMRVLSLASKGWGRVIFFDRFHRKAVPNKMASAQSEDIYRWFSADEVSSSFAEAAIEFQTRETGPGRLPPKSSGPSSEATAVGKSTRGKRGGGGKRSAPYARGKGKGEADSKKAASDQSGKDAKEPK